MFTPSVGFARLLEMKTERSRRWDGTSRGPTHNGKQATRTTVKFDLKLSVRFSRKSSIRPSMSPAASPSVGTWYSTIIGGKERGEELQRQLLCDNNTDRMPGIDFTAVVVFDGKEKNRSDFDTFQRPLPEFVGPVLVCFKFY